MDVEVLRALAEPNRLAIVELLRDRPRTVGEIVEALGLRQSQVSKHLHTLVEAGLVTTYPVAQQRYQGLRPERLAELHTWLGGFSDLWDTRSSIRGLYDRSMREGRPIPAPERPFRIEHLTPAPPEAVWAAWTEAGLLAQWFAPDYFTVPECRVDARPGGALFLVLQAPDGTRFPMSGTYQEVDAPGHLSYAATPLDEAGEPLFELMITMTSTGDGTGGTRLVVDAAVVHTRPEAAVHLAGLEPGWAQNLTKLDSLLTREKS